jgi:hypothetical protein
MTVNAEPGPDLLSDTRMAQSSNLQVLQRKNADDVVVTMAIRSPLCKAKKGGFRDMRLVFLLVPASCTYNRVCVS